LAIAAELLVLGDGDGFGLWAELLDGKSQGFELGKLLLPEEVPRPASKGLGLADASLLRCSDSELPMLGKGFAGGGGDCLGFGGGFPDPLLPIWVLGL
jgi:hypothetical protein